MFPEWKRQCRICRKSMKWQTTQNTTVSQRNLLDVIQNLCSAGKHWLHCPHQLSTLLRWSLGSKPEKKKLVSVFKQERIPQVESPYICVSTTFLFPCIPSLSTDKCTKNKRLVLKKVRREQYPSACNSRHSPHDHTRLHSNLTYLFATKTKLKHIFKK